MFSQYRVALADPLLRVPLLCIMLLGPAAASILPFQSVIGVERLGMSNWLYALVGTAGAVFSVAASMVVGIVTDQTGKYRGALVACILVGASAGVFMLAAPSVPIFILVHAVLFPIAATTYTQYFALAAVAAERNPKLDKDAGLSLVRAAFAGSFAITPPLWAILLARGADLMTVYSVLTLANLGVLLIVLRLWPRGVLRSAENQTKLTFREALQEVMTGPILVRLFLVAVVTSSNGLYNILLGLLVITRIGGSEADVGWFSGGVAAVEMPVMLATALFVKRISRQALIFFGCVIYGLSLIALGHVPSMGVAWWLILPFGIGAGIILAVPLAYVQGLVAHRPGAGSALLSMTHFGGTIVASAIFATGTAFASYAGVAVLGAVMAIAAGVTLYRIG